MANVKATDLIDFTRASKGHALAKVSYGDELVVNGGFDTDSNWTGGSNWSIAAGVAVSDGGSGLFQQTETTLDTSKVYLFQFDITSYTSGSVKLYSGSGSDPVNYVSSVGTHSVVFTPLSTTPSLYSNSFNGSIDNVSIKEIYVDNQNGTLQLFEHPNNIPRIEYDADGNLLGLLIEEARTNNITNSESCSFVDESGGTVTASTTPAPYGTSSSVKRVQSSTLNGGGRLQVTVLTGGDNYCSVYVRSRTGADQNLKITASGTTGATQVAPASGDWVRLGRVASLGAGSRDIRVLSTGDTIDLDIALPQVEAGSFPTSYIKTTGSTASRSADVASIDVDQFGYNQNEGTITVTGRSYEPGLDNYFFEMAEDGANRSFIKCADFSHLLVTSSNSIQANISAGTITANTEAKLAVAIEANNFGVSLDGGAVVTDTSGTPELNVSEFRVGSNRTGGEILNGHIKSLTYTPKRLSNAKLQELTS